LIHSYPLPVCGNIGALLSGKVVEVVGAKLDEQKWQEVEAVLPKLIS
jgi:hypothetical protein